MNYNIGKYEIREDSRELLHDGVPEKVEPLIFRLLLFLINNPNRALSREELIDNVWDSRVISDSALSASICTARHAIGDTANRQKYIKTLSGFGYRFISEFDSGSDSDEEKIDSDKTISKQSEEPKNISRKKSEIKHCASIPISESNLEYKHDTEYQQEPLQLPDKPSIAIMDFIDISPNKESSLLAGGLATEINSGLARLPHFFVIARDSASILSKQRLMPSEISQRLGVRYLVYATTKRINERAQVTLSVIDATHNCEIWSEHYDYTLDDLALAQSEMVKDIVTAIDSVIEQAEIDRAFIIPTENLSAWENYHRGLWHIHRTTAKDIVMAQQFFQKAISLDSRFSRAYAALSYTHTSHKIFSATPVESIKDTDKAYEYGQNSIDYCKREAMAYMALGRASFFAREHQHALNFFDEGIQLDTNYFHCYYLKGIVAAYSTQDSLALQLLESASRLSPLDPLQFSNMMGRATALAHSKQYDEAAKWGLRASSHPSSYFTTHAITAACLQLANRSDEAKHFATKVLTLKPDYSIEAFKRLTPHTDEASRKLFINAMIASGIPMVSDSN